MGAEIVLMNDAALLLCRSELLTMRRMLFTCSFGDVNQYCWHGTHKYILGNCNTVIEKDCWVVPEKADRLLSVKFEFLERRYKTCTEKECKDEPQEKCPKWSVDVVL